MLVPPAPAPPGCLPNSEPAAYLLSGQGATSDWSPTLCCMSLPQGCPMDGRFRRCSTLRQKNCGGCRRRCELSWSPPTIRRGAAGGALAAGRRRKPFAVWSVGPRQVTGDGTMVSVKRRGCTRSELCASTRGETRCEGGVRRRRACDGGLVSCVVLKVPHCWWQSARGQVHVPRQRGGSGR